MLQQLCGEDCKLDLYQEQGSTQVLVSGQYVEGQSDCFLIAIQLILCIVQSGFLSRLMRSMQGWSFILKGSTATSMLNQESFSWELGTLYNYSFLLQSQIMG